MRSAQQAAQQQQRQQLAQPLAPHARHQQVGARFWCQQARQHSSSSSRSCACSSRLRLLLLLPSVRRLPLQQQLLPWPSRRSLSGA